MKGSLEGMYTNLRILPKLSGFLFNSFPPRLAKTARLLFYSV